MTSPAQTPHEITALLRAARSAFVTRAVVEGIAWGALAASVALVAGVLGLGPLDLGRAWRDPFVCIGLLASAGALAWRALHATLRWRNPQVVAQQLERSFPSLRTDVRASLDLTAAGAAPNPDAAALRAHLVARVGGELRAAIGDIGRATPRRDLRPVVASTAGVVLALMVATELGPASVRDGLSRLLAGYPVPVSDLVPQEFPLVTAFDLLLGYPAYTGLPPRRVIGTRGDVDALPGTTVELTGSALFPIVEARLVVVGGATDEIVPLDVVDNRRFSGTFVVHGPGEYRVELGPADGGERRTDPLRRPIRIEADQPPLVELITPESMLEVSADAVVDFEYIASDEFGLGPVQLVWTFAADDARRVSPLRDATGERTSQEHVPLDLAELSLQPRDEIVVFIEALDNNAIAGPQAGRSRPVTIRVAAPEDRHAAILALKEQLFESLLARLGAGLPASLNEWHAGSAVADGSGDPSGEGSDSAAQQLEPRLPAGDPAALATRIQAANVAREGWTETIDLIAQLRTAMADDPLSTVADIELIDTLSTRLVAAERDHARAIEDAMVMVRTGRDVTPQYPVAAAADAELINRTERAVLLLQDLVASHQAQDAERTLQEVDALRDRLRELLEQYRATNDPELREQIERELARLESRMRELLEQLASQVQNLPYEHLNAEGLEPSELSEQVNNMGSSLDEVRQMLDQGNIDGALAALENLGQNLDSLSAEMGGALDQARPDQLSEFDQAMGELMDSINDIEAQQQAIEQQTSALNEQMNAERQAELRDEIERRLAEARQQVDAVQQAFREAPDNLVSEETRELLIEADRGLQQLEGTLERGDVPTAAEQATQLQSTMDDLMWQADRELRFSQRDGERSAQLQSNRNAAQQGQRSMQSIASSLGELVQMSQPRPNAAQTQQLNELAQQQDGVRQQLDQLGQRMQELSERHPVPGPDGPPMQQAREGMDSSSRELRGTRPRPAQQGQLQALEGMRQMRQQLQQMMQQQRRQEGQNGRQNSRQDVEIPEESEAARRQWREQVMDGMREGGLENYEEQLRWYYESLVR